MTFPQVLSDSKIDYLAGLDYKAKVYLLVWSNPPVFKARVNQTTFDNSFATITFDQTDEEFDSGSYTDAIEGYLCYLSTTTDIRDNYAVLRLRSDSSSTQLFVEYTSQTRISDNNYIFVIKDTRFSNKHPLDFRDTGGQLYIDYDEQFHLPPPVISGIKTAYLGIIKSNSGYYDLVVNPGVTIVEPGSSVSTWTLTLDAGTQQSFNSSTGSAVIRYTEPGNYMPRWKVIDDNGNSQWFAPHVFIEDETLKNVVNLNTRGCNISYTVDGGGVATVPFFDGVKNVLDKNFVAIYIDGHPDIGGNNIAFVGNFATDVLSSDYTNPDGDIQNATFELHGIGQQMLFKNSFTWVFKNDATPANFQELEKATLWRVVATYLLFLTNFNNMYSLSFDDSTDDYQSSLFPIEATNVLDAMTFIMERNKSQFDYGFDGSVRMVRNAVYQSTADRNNLPVVANWDKRHYATKTEDGFLWERQHSHMLRVSKSVTGGGWYNTTTKQIDVLAAYVPGVVAAGGQDTIELNGQLLKANQTKTQASVELLQRAKDGFAASQEIDTLPAELPDSFALQISPSVAAWHTHNIQDTDNLRGKSYTASTRWLLTEMSIDIDLNSQRVQVSPIWQVETSDLGFGGIVAEPPPDVAYPAPVLPQMPAIKNFVENPTNMLPTGAIPFEDDPPIKQKDTNKTTEAQDPLAASTINETTSGFSLLAWDDNKLYVSDDFGYTSTPTWTDTGLPLQSGHKIKQAAWDRFFDTKQACYVVSNNDDINSPETRVYFNRAPLSIAGWTAVDLADLLSTQVNACSKNNAIIYGKFKQFISASWTLDLLSGFGIEVDGEIVLFPWSLDTNHPAYPNVQPGTYDSGNDIWKGHDSDTGGGKVCMITFYIPPGVTITGARMRVRVTRPDVSTSGNRFSQVWHLDPEGNYTQIGSTIDAGAGFYTDRELYVGDLTITPITEGGSIEFRCSMDKKGGAAKADIIEVDLVGSSLADYVGTRFTTDNAQSFEGGRSVGLMTLGEGSMTRRFGQRVLAAKDAQVKRAPLPDQPYLFNADQGDTSGQYAKALLKFDTNDDYLLAPDGGSIGLYRILNNVRTDITPNDGSNDGFVVGVGGLAMRNNSKDDAWFLGDFGGTIKLAYTNNLRDGTPTWNFNTQVTADAIWVSVKPNARDDAIQVAVADGNVIKYSIDGGVIFYDRNAPGTAMKGVEWL